MSRWFRVYDELIDDPKVMCLPPDLFRFLIQMWCLASQNSGRLPAVEHIAYKTRASVEHVNASILALIRLDLCDQFSNQHSTWVAPHGWSKRQFKSDTSTERVKRFRNVSSSVTETPPEQIQKTDTEADTEAEVDKKEPRASGALRSVEPDGFDEFYQAYPNKVGKQAARKAWPKAIKAIGSLVLMLDAVDRYIQQKPPDRQYMNPATFLSGQRWLDQPAIVNGHHNGQLQKDGQPTIATVIRAHQEQLRRELSAEEGTDGDDISPSFDHVGWLPGR